ncbi:tRNA pseudouridine synthase A [Noviherbaspirillum aridicola]|uniref:tRNA pseudouridine synthase A n=1 Tax=Noviherbaspirillum aridicola TaxID=2849687 RepID=A0ABQ4Q5D5_9BURK|nr:tRNA pseudouridine synthase A [Noviherbaspirillum aridicola]
MQYDGSSWRGWQTQPGGGTVQDTLEAALQRFALTPVATTCAGRTDAGVHALEQVVHFDTALDREMFSWVRGVNAFLPPSIAVRWATGVPGGGDGFHARFSATSRTYHYVLYNHPVRSPLLSGKAGWVFRPLDIERMRAAAAHLIGTHDFSAFRAAECQAKSPVKQMHSIELARQGDIIVITLTASAFLHHMVRNIVGSLIVVGNGNQPPEWIAAILAGRDRSQAAPTFMPDGLYLGRIGYAGTWGLPQEQPAMFPWLQRDHADVTDMATSREST